MDAEHCPDCREPTDSIEMMIHGGFCKACFDGLGLRDDDQEEDDEALAR